MPAKTYEILSVLQFVLRYVENNLFKIFSVKIVLIFFYSENFEENIIKNELGHNFSYVVVQGPFALVLWKVITNLSLEHILLLQMHKHTFLHFLLLLIHLWSFLQYSAVTEFTNVDHFGICNALSHHLLQDGYHRTKSIYLRLEHSHRVESGRRGQKSRKK